jgi:hypothetical protein
VRAPSSLTSPSKRSIRAGLSPSSPGVRSLHASPPTRASDVHSRGPGPPSARRCHTSDHVPPSRFLPALTACSIRASRVCCTPQPVVRFAAFQPAQSRNRSPCSCAASPRRAHPSKNSSPVAVPRHRGRMPSCRCGPLRVRCATAPCSRSRARLGMGPCQPSRGCKHPRSRPALLCSPHLGHPRGRLGSVHRGPGSS